MIEGLMIWAVIIVIYLLSKTNSAFKNIWSWIGMFLMCVLIVLSFGYVSDSVKKWWKE